MKDHKKNSIQILSIILGFTFLILFFYSDYRDDTIDSILSIFPKSYLNTGWNLKQFTKYIIYPFCLTIASAQIIYQTVWFIKKAIKQKDKEKEKQGTG
jgi:hypothetical protein